MTLILTAANPCGAHQSSDYQLINEKTMAPVSDRAGSKQLQATFNGLHIQLAFTGVAIADLGTPTQRTIDLLSAILSGLLPDSQLQDICNALANRCTVAMKPLGERGVLTLVLTVGGAREPFRVVEISNARWGVRPPRARDHFQIRIHTIRRPFHLISGFRDCVPAAEERRLLSLARSADKSPTEILDALAAINAIAARNSGGFVSEECWATSQFADGQLLRYMARNVGEQPGSIPMLQGALDLSDWVRKNMRPAPGKEIGMVQSAGVMGRGTPVPPPEGEPRLFTLSGSSIVGSLRSPTGQHCASIEISQLPCQIRARRNEQITVPFAGIRLKGEQACADFPPQRWPWPTMNPEFSIDGVPVSDGQQYPVKYWVEAAMNRVEIPRTSRGIRKIAFLGDDDELVIVVSDGTFTWAPSQDGPTATLEANVWWRVRLDGT